MREHEVGRKLVDEKVITEAQLHLFHIAEENSQGNDKVWIVHGGEDSEIRSIATDTRYPGVLICELVSGRKIAVEWAQLRAVYFD